MFKITDYEFYNEKVKEEYLNSLSNLNDASKKIIATELARARTLENELGKDIYAFNSLEVEKLIINRSSSTELTLRGTVSNLKQYTDWAISNNLCMNDLNEFAEFQKIDDLSEYIPNCKILNKYLTKEEFFEFMENLVNPMDKLLVALPYNFIMGEKLEEIRSLKLSDLDSKSNILTIRDDNDNEIRKQIIPRYLVDLIIETASIDSYIINNGEKSENGVSERILAETDYLIKPLRTKNNLGLKCSYGFVQSKFTKIKSYFGNQYTFVTPMTIRMSRIFHVIENEMKLQEVSELNNLVSNESFEKIRDWQGVSFTEMQEYNIRVNYKKYKALKDK